MKETKSQNQQACQKKKYTSQKSENISVSKKTLSDEREGLQELIEVGTPQEQVLAACIILV
jgi:DNA invertase Pin-like site-specific DNA recombinase